MGTGAEAPEIFWVLLYLYKSTSPGGETSLRPNFRPACGRPHGAAPTILTLEDELKFTAQARPAHGKAEAGFSARVREGKKGYFTFSIAASLS